MANTLQAVGRYEGVKVRKSFIEAFIGIGIGHQ
jgi:hypothetical protein